MCMMMAVCFMLMRMNRAQYAVFVRMPAAFHLHGGVLDILMRQRVFDAVDNLLGLDNAQIAVDNDMAG